MFHAPWLCEITIRQPQVDPRLDSLRSDPRRNEAQRLHSGEVVIQKQSLVAKRAFGRRGHTDVRFQLPREDRSRIDKPEVMVRPGYWDKFRMAIIQK